MHVIKELPTDVELCFVITDNDTISSTINTTSAL